MRVFQIERIAQQEFEQGVGWYEPERLGLGFEFIEEVDRVLTRIETQEKFVTAPLAVLDGGVVRREFVRRFPLRGDLRRDRADAKGDHDPSR